MKRVFQCLLVALCSLNFALTVYSDDSDFIDEKGKALRHLKVVPGTKRNNIDFHTVEQEAGRAVLKLLDAKIGKKVNDAAKEVTDFLNDAVGHHANQRAANIQSDKQKEMSLLHLGAKKVLTNLDEESKPKKNKDGSFLVNFKIPYIVTRVNEKKKPKAKKFHHKHAKKPYWKKYHHSILHHKHHHHHHHHHPHVSDVSKPPASSPPAPYNTQAQAPQAQSPPSPPPSYNAIDLSFNGYNWTYNYSNDTSQDMIPCQGNCMDPCTQQCSMSQDCCCCDPNLMAQTQMAAAPLQAAPAVPAYQQVVPMAQPEYQPPPMPAVQPEQCPMGCKRNCFTYCPRDCCGVAGKRDKVLGSGNREDTADQMESGHKGEGSGNENVADEETEQSQVEESDKQQSSSEKQDDSTKSEEETTDSTREGSTKEQNDDAELDD